MITLDRIVVGIDGSEAADQALRWAGEEAVLWTADLEVIHAWLPGYPVNPHDLFIDYEPWERAASQHLAASVSGLRHAVPLLGEVHETTTIEHPAAALLEAAKSAALLVVGSRGRGGFASLLLGSVSQRCVTHAPCPVAVVPRAWTPSDHGRVVVGVDGSATSALALRWAAHEAARRGARLDVFNAWTVPEIVVPTGVAFLGDAAALQQASRTLLDDMVGALEDDLDGKPPDLELHAVDSAPAAALVEAGRRADVLVVGARGLGGFRGLLLGSVSQQCAHHAPCPTIVVHDTSAAPAATP